LIKKRLMVEVEYLIALAKVPEVSTVPEMTSEQIEALRKIYQDFTVEEAQQVKEIEKTTNHDVKAVEYYLRTKLKLTGFENLQEMVHFGLTSQDINNTATPLLLQEAVDKELLPKLYEISEFLEAKAKEYRDVAMLSRTHGQPASPTTVGKELAVFVSRIRRQTECLQQMKLEGKFSGATGNFHTHMIAFPEVDWLKFSEEFLNHLGLRNNKFTTQITPYDDLAEVFDCIRRNNVILIDLCQDVWTYISHKYFKQRLKEGEVGSSTMPHKVNPIDFENAEGNLGIANSLLDHLSNKLPISRMQRDLTDSTVLRNLGLVIGHSLLAYNSLLKGLNKLEINKIQLSLVLEKHYEVLAEPIQTILRKENVPGGYEKMKELTRGEEITAAMMKNLIEKLEISQFEKDKLLKLTPEKYIGMAGKIVDLL